MEGSSGVRKGAWTAEEDNLLRKCIESYGEGQWHRVPLRSGLNRCRKSCRLRWLNYLKPSIKRGGFSADEVDLMVRLHKLLGNRWSLIAGRLPGRTANDVKNYWNTHLSKKQNSCKIKNSTEKINTTPAPPPKKVNVIKPQPRSFSKKSCLLPQGQPETALEQNNNVYDISNNKINDENNDKNGCNNDMLKENDLSMSDLASESRESKWWECLLDGGREETEQNMTAPADQEHSSWIKEALSSFDIDLWSIFNAEHA